MLQWQKQIKAEFVNLLVGDEMTRAMAFKHISQVCDPPPPLGFLPSALILAGVGARGAEKKIGFVCFEQIFISFRQFKCQQRLRTTAPKALCPKKLNLPSEEPRDTQEAGKSRLPI